MLHSVLGRLSNHQEGASMSILVQQSMEASLANYVSLVKTNGFEPDHLKGQLHSTHLGNIIVDYGTDKDKLFNGSSDTVVSADGFETIEVQAATLVTEGKVADDAKEAMEVLIGCSQFRWLIARMERGDILSKGRNKGEQLECLETYWK
jgi:hypothetical protein